MLGRLPHIRVRGRLQSDKDIARPGKTRRYVAVKVEGASNRYLRANNGTHFLDQYRLRRSNPFRVHGSVESKEDSINGHRGAEALHDPVDRIATKPAVGN